MAVGTYLKAALSISIFLAAVGGAAASAATQAQPEYPFDGAIIIGDEAGANIWTKLIFIPGATAVEHTGYFSDDYSKVYSRAEDANLGSPPYASVSGWEYTFFAGNPAVPPADDSLVRGTKYYWTVDETDALGNTFAGEIWEFAIQGFKAFAPDPPNEATFVETEVLLSWYPGLQVNRNEVYIGTDRTAVENADSTDTTGIYKGYTSETFYQCSNLAFNTTYYWRIDELYCHPYPLCHYYKGDVWNFTTEPRRIFVDVDATGANNGTNWADAYECLRYGLDAARLANKPVEICVAQGIYRPDKWIVSIPTADRRILTFQLINGVTLKGGYAGFGQPNPDARDIQLYETVLSGDLAGNDRDVIDPCELLNDPCRAENSYHVVTGSGTDANAILEGFTITGGNANGPIEWPSIYCRGGGMYNDSNSPTVNKCTFNGNSAHWGGGMFTNSGDPRLTNCTFEGNWALWGGGGMCSWSWNGSATLVNCKFRMNSTLSEGGGMLNGGWSVLTDCTFTGNSAGYGGGISNGGTPVLLNCTFSGNSASHNGGGMSNLYTSGSPTLVNCIFEDNSAHFGGGMDNYESNPILINCIFAKNSSGESGGGMCNGSWVWQKLINCTFVANVADQDGGGISNLYSFEGITSLTNCMFVGNSAEKGNALAFDLGPSHYLVTNCILWDGGNEIWNNDGSTITITYSDVQGGWAGLGNIDADPCFVDAVGGDLRLSSDSPCIDAGYNNAPNLPPTDLDGHPRIIDGDCNDTNMVDMGAYEFNYAYMGDFDYNCRVNFADLSIFGSAWTSQPGDINWDFACNISIPADNIIDKLDLAAFADNWLAGIQ